MTKINWSRVILGGLVAGLIINAAEFLVNGLILQAWWAEVMKGLGKPEMMSGVQIAAFNVSGFLMGILTVWFYAAIRPRYGAGPKTAVCAGAAVWALGYLLAGVAPMVLHILPRRLMAIGIAAGLVEVIAAALVGAWLYKEESVSR
jgi:hypothetical protein